MKNIKYIHRNPKGWQFRKIINGQDVSYYVGDNKFKYNSKAKSLAHAIMIRDSVLSVAI